MHLNKEIVVSLTDMKLARVRRNLHGEANNQETIKSNDKGASLSNSIRDICHDDGENSSCDVDGNRHELGLVRRVSEILDDRREKQADSVQGTNDLAKCQNRAQRKEEFASTYTPIHDDADPNLPVFKGTPDILPFELFGLGNLHLIRVDVSCLGLVF